MTMNYILNRLSIVLICAVFVLSACESDDPPLPDNVVGFTASESGIADDEAEATISIALSRAAEVAIPLTIEFETTGVEYGEHFTTDPAAVNNKLSLTIPAGSTALTFKVKKEADIFLEGSESIKFNLTDAGEPIVLGDKNALELSFSSIVSTGSELTLNGLIGAEAGSSAGNTVYLDFSNNTQTALARTGWDLGFYNGTDFRVVINHIAGASVVAVDKTDIATVTSVDINPDDLKLGFGEGTFEIVDDVFGDMTKTAIPAISATPGDNKVYVINRVGGSGAIGPVEDLVKVRVVRRTNGYTLQYAKINETTFTSLDIDKSDATNFTYVSLSTGKVEFEPAKAKWDIQWSWGIFRTENPPGSGVWLPYGFSDLVFTNYLNDTQAAEILTTTSTYEAFSETNLAGVTWSSERNAIGSHWRVTSPAASAGVKTDRFYLVKDSGGNIYKVKFVSFHSNDGGTRGKPVIKYALVKKGGS
jgi:hypothetical protein